MILLLIVFYLKIWYNLAEESISVNILDIE